VTSGWYVVVVINNLNKIGSFIQLHISRKKTPVFLGKETCQMTGLIPFCQRVWWALKNLLSRSPRIHTVSFQISNFLRCSFGSSMKVQILWPFPSQWFFSCLEVKFDMKSIFSDAACVNLLHSILSFCSHWWIPRKPLLFTFPRYHLYISCIWNYWAL